MRQVTAEKLPKVPQTEDIKRRKPVLPLMRPVMDADEEPEREQDQGRYIIWVYLRYDLDADRWNR